MSEEEAGSSPEKEGVGASEGSARDPRPAGRSVPATSSAHRLVPQEETPGQTAADTWAKGTASGAGDVGLLRPPLPGTACPPPAPQGSCGKAWVSEAAGGRRPVAGGWAAVGLASLSASAPRPHKWLPLADRL